jgi:putative FmdB family regulatory protein
MPIYEYACDDCGKLCEVIQKITDDPISTCPECSGQMHKLISHTSFILKGTGWYVTDYASPERKKALQSDGPINAKKQEKPDTMTESKAETKAATNTESAAKI